MLKQSDKHHHKGLKKWLIRIGAAVLALVVGGFIFFKVQGWGTWPWAIKSYDLNNLPQIVTNHYIDMDRIYAVSKFRSGAGHDNSDGYESCRSMKHYFAGSQTDKDPTSIALYAPTDAKVVFFSPDGSDVQIWLRPDAHPSILFMIFHTVPEVKIGQQVKSGERIGHHSGKSWSDMQVVIHGLIKDRYVSYFEVMNDEVFAYFARLGFARSDFIITKAERDANPLKCSFGPSSLTRTGMFETEEPRDKAYVELRPDPGIGHPANVPPAPQNQPPLMR